MSNAESTTGADALVATVEDEIAQLTMERPHVVILGAGASRAAVLHGDKHGRRSPLIADFVQILNLGGLLDDLRIDHEGQNFEDIYSALDDDSQARQRSALEEAVFEYFDAMELPDEPTIYDHLILALRKKDLIATFNWDPFLVQAYSRNGGSVGELPRLAFLHGNVRIGYCANDKTTGMRDDVCSKCRQPRTPSPLLYPIKHKDYASNEFIGNEWSRLTEYLKRAFWVTIFGYSAPKTDQEALAAMTMAWGSSDQRPLEQIEIISIDERGKLQDDWQPFIHSHHFDIHSDFYESWIAKHPRRTGEAYQNQYWEAKFISDNRIPRAASFDELREWFAPLLRREGFVMRAAC